MTPARFWTLAILLSVSTSALVVIAVRALRPRAPGPSLVTVSDVPPPVDVVAVLRAMQLVTVQIDAGVRSSSASESWRGDVLATVIAPARYFYAIDLSGLTGESLRRDPMTGVMSVSVPEPRRLAVEVYPDQRQDRVEVSGTRLRDVAGEYHLGLARMGLYAQARSAELLEGDRARLHAMSIEQVESLVRTLSGHRGPIRVRLVPSPEAPTPPAGPGLLTTAP
jgi:hypothetical protein